MNSKYLLAALAAGVLTACGGGGGGGEAEGTAPGGLYIGYYQEDAANNPEDPMPGSYYLQLPEGNARFAGEMSFTYIGCQTSNVGTVSGNKNGVALDGNWTGTVDGTPVGGPYTGRYDAASPRYSGTYRNAAGKVRISGCGTLRDYDVAALGTWEMFPVEARSPSDFTVTVAGGNVNWADVAGVTRWLASIYDVARTTSGSNAVTRQTIIPAVSGSTDQTVPLSSLGMTSGRAYVLAVTAFNSSNQRIGYTSLRYTAP